MHPSRFFVLCLALSACRSAAKDDSIRFVDTGGLSDDADGDGLSGDDDCDDLDPSVYPGAIEVCDGVDNNCDGQIDEGVLQTYFEDVDGDGFGDAAASDEACAPEAGYSTNPDDCNDADASIYPGAPELCDSIDNNCDGIIDDGDIQTWYADADGDGFGDPDTTVDDCSPGSGWVLDGSDCDDADITVNPDGTEVCNEVDDDCDTEVDEGVTSVFYRDEDGDSYGQVGATTEACAAPGGYTETPGDCDDSEAAVNPGATEVCNSIDDDCDGLVDIGAADASSWYDDGDGDGYGDAATATSACDQPSGTVADNTDCDDSLAAVNPAANEVCNSIDDDCDSLVDDADTSVDLSTATSWYDDDDGDSYGDVSASTLSCSAPTGTVADNTDCDDSAAAVNPGETEVCNGIDDDCDALIDDDDSSVDASTGSTWYTDSDSDGYGDASSTTISCSAPSNGVSDNTDCDDSLASVNPGETEVCNSIDDDCDTLVDDDDSSVDLSTATTWYDDDDGDFYGDASASTLSCDPPSGTVTDNTDCDDSLASVNPGELEVCNSIDDDCDSLVDDDDGSLDTSTATTWYDDDDLDGYGDGSAATRACTQPSGTATSTTDCDDTEGTVYPGAPELCNLVDDDCDGTIDDGTMGSASACAAESCLEILVDQPSSGSGSYYIDFDGTATSTTCDMVTDGGGWTLMFDDDFESTPDPGWSISSTYSCGSWSNLLGGYGIMAYGEIDIIVDFYGVSHTETWVELEYLALDSWDGETAYVTADGTTLLSRSQDNHNSSYSEVCGWNRGYEGSYDSSHTVDSDFAHTADDLEIIAGSTLNQAATDESFGIDDVMVWVR